MELHNAMAKHLRDYLEEMRISTRLGDLMMSTPPENVRWLTDAEQDELGLPGADPVDDEVTTAQNAEYYRLTSAEFRSRNTTALKECETLIRESVAAPQDHEKGQRFLACIDRAILRLPPAEVSARYGVAEASCPVFMDKCWQAIVVDGLTARGESPNRTDPGR
jgi:hypothetical protein